MTDRATLASRARAFAGVLRDEVHGEPDRTPVEITAADARRIADLVDALAGAVEEVERG